jgi:hypothetical protein
MNVPQRHETLLIRSHAYRLAAAGDFVLQLEDSKKKLPLPVQEIQVRHLINKIPESRRIQCWEGITQKYKPQEWTGDIIEVEVVKFRKTIPKDELNKTKPELKVKKKNGVKEAKKSGKELIKKLKKAVSILPNADEILKQLLKIEELIG